jgi:hypothetical protein
VDIKEKNPNSVSISDMQARIKKATYTLMADGRTTFCCLEMVNGYSVWGKSACVDLANYNQALGEKYAYEDAINVLWPLEGYLLAEQIYRGKE